MPSSRPAYLAQAANRNMIALMSGDVRRQMEETDRRKRADREYERLAAARRRQELADLKAELASARQQLLDWHNLEQDAECGNLGLAPDQMHGALDEIGYEIDRAQEKVVKLEDEIERRSWW